MSIEFNKSDVGIIEVVNIVRKMIEIVAGASRMARESYGLILRIVSEVLNKEERLFE